MIRGLACLAVVLIAAALGGPAVQTLDHVNSSQAVTPRLASPTDPLNYTGSSVAFNYTYSAADLYTQSNATITGSGGTFTWFSTAKHTSNGSPITGTAFNFTSNPNPSVSRQEVNWTLTIPKSNCSTCSLFVEFTLYGNLTKGTSENFTLTSTKDNSIVKRVEFLGNHTSPVYLCGLSASTGGLCIQPTAEINVDSWFGYSLRLSFRFGWNNTSEAMIASVGEVRVAEIDNVFKNSGAGNNVMTQTSANTMTHYATLSPVNYNATVQYTVNGTGPIKPHTWRNEVINFYYPSGYNITKLEINSTSGPPTTLYPSGSVVPFETNNCYDASCSVALVAINMSDFQSPNSPFVRSSTLHVTAVSHLSIVHLNTQAGGVATSLFSAGQTLGVNITNNLSVRNMTETEKRGTLRISVTDPSGTALLGTPSSTTTSSGGVSNFTLPVSCGSSTFKCGIWNINATFLSLFDYGQMLGSFRLDQLQVSSFSGSGGNAGLSVQGSLAYSNSSAASGATGLVFAVDAATSISTPITNNGTISSSGLYISSVSLINGVFTPGTSLTMIFTVVNSNTSSTPSPLSALLTVDHEWPGSPSQLHGVESNFTLGLGGGLGDLPFNQGPQTYRAVFTFTESGIQLALSTITGASQVHMMSPGSSPVSPSQAHAGLFKLTIVTKSSGTTISTTSIESPPYADVFGLPFAPGRYLAYSSVFTGASISLTLKSDAILGAKKLVVFALARDPAGITLSNVGSTGIFSDSTVLTSTMDTIGEVSANQQVTATIHLSNNSTTLTQSITVSLSLQGSGIIANQTGVSIGPGGSQTVSIQFSAPSTPGQYTLSFLSRQYLGGISLASQTLKVTLVQSNLQILIPAGIGVVVAIIVMGAYLVRSKGPGKGDEEVTRTKSSKGGEEETKTKSQGPKPKPSSGNPPSKSLTRTERLDW